MSSLTTSGGRNPVEALAEEFLERKRRGEPATPEEYAAARPDLAEEILTLFPALLMTEDVRGDAGSRTGSLVSGPGPATAGATAGRLGEFRLLREIGRGGMGVVYEAEQESLGRRVALKVLPAQLLTDAQKVRRFQREARSAAKLHHTNIVPVFGVGHHEGTHFYVMQFIQGQALDVVLEELRQLRQARSDKPGASGRTPRRRAAAEIAVSLATGRFAVAPGGGPVGLSATLLSPSKPTPESPGSEPPQSDSGTSSLLAQSGVSQVSETDRGFAQGVARIGVQVAQALAYAHAQGILHRDIKPSNLLLDRDGTVWVADFGLAKAVGGEDLTQTGDIVGTLRYMAPERFGGAGDARADIYALGLTLYELLALRPAFEQKDRASLIRQVTQEEPPRLRKLNGKVPADLERVVHKAIAREPAQRYATAAALREDLERYLEGRPILARRVSPLERASRWCRRNPAVAGLLAMVAVLLATGFVASAAAAFHFRRIAASESAARADAEQARVRANLALRQAVAAQTEAVARRREAEASSTHARRAVDEYFTQVSESRLLKEPNLQPLRLDLLKSAQAFYETFLKERADDPSLRSELLATRRRVAAILADLGREAEARAALRAARDGYEQALGERPADLDLRAGLAATLCDLAAQGAESRIPLFRRAIAIYEELLRSRPGDDGVRRDLARAYNGLGAALRSEDPKASVLAHGRGLELRLDLADAHPDDFTLTNDLASSFNSVAALVSPRGSSSLHIAALRRQAVEVGRVALRQQRGSVRAADALAGYTYNLGLAHSYLGQYDESIGEYRTTLDLLARQVRENPDVPAYRVTYLSLVQDLMDRLMFFGRRDEWARTRREALPVIDGMPGGTAEELFARARQEAAFSVAATNAGLMTLTRDDLRLAAELADRAVATLSLAVAAGFHDPQRLKSEPDLFPLRARGDFRALLARVESAAKSGRPPADAARIPAGLGDPGEALHTLDARAALRYAVGLSLLDIGKLDEAGAALSEAARLHARLAETEPEKPRHRTDLALDLIARGDLEQQAGRGASALRSRLQAEPILSRAVARTPDDLWLWRTLGSLHSDLGRDDEAADDLEKVLRLMPHTANDRVHASPRSEQMVELAAQTRAFARLLERHPDDGSLWLGRGRFHLLRSQWEPAAADFARAVVSATAKSEEWLEHAALRLLVGDRDGYRAFLRGCLRREGGTSDPFVAYVLARVCCLSPDPLDDPERILRWAELAATIGDYPWYRLPLGIALYRAGRDREAIRVLEEVGAGGFEFGERLFVTAMACERLGDAATARAWLDRGRTWIQAKGSRRTNGAVTIPSTDWGPAHVYLREAEAVILLDPIFPADPFAR
jgi:serine/threonine protein kinase